MSNHHIEMLSHIANMEYALNQIHARTPITDSEGISISHYATRMRNHIHDSQKHHLSNNPDLALISLKHATLNGAVATEGLEKVIAQQRNDADNGDLDHLTVMRNFVDATSALNHFKSFMDSGRNYARDIMNNLPKIVEEKKKEIKGQLDNAREVVDSIADEHNIILPDGWDSGRGTPPPNKE